MAQLLVPLQPIPAQLVSVVLAQQNCRLNIYQKASGLYMDVYLSGALVVGGVAALNGVKIVRDAYLGFIGDLAFFDTQGLTDPVYSGLGSRYILMFLN